ncbi:MAG: selenoneine biosynthesis selenosugar synthase SenB [Piscinibacter sp.]|uniref:selenoneine biosynthesis selenosugar synthase SenB n=1 Tax=Piscinibacter sp. TaxID=1903157 RepID=UPI003D12377B
MHRKSIVIVTPALADANNGNWQTARRWARMLSAAYRVRLAAAWSEGDEDLMIALHARRSAASILAWRERRGAAPLVVVLTGTDLYRDIDTDERAQRSLQLADALVVLNAHGAERLPPVLRERTHVILQSCSARRPVPKPAQHLRALMVGHLRDEKDPGTYLRAVQRLSARTDLFFDHIGGALDPTQDEQATRLAARHPRYRWLGPLPHVQARRRIQAAHVLVHASRMEGGAHVVIEALRSGTPVIASRIDGNLGLLGDDWPATFEVGDDAALATLIERARDEPAMLADLQRRAVERAPLFSPEAERAALMRVVRSLMDARTERRDRT